MPLHYHRVLVVPKSSIINPIRHASSISTRCMHQSPLVPRPAPRLRNPRFSTSCPRLFSTTPTRQLKTIEQASSKTKSGPFSALAGLVFLVAGAGLIFYFRTEKARMDRQRIAEAAKGVGRPKVGGPFELLDQNGDKFTDKDMKQGFSLVYFGFSHCPDICPEELDKMARMVDLVFAAHKNSIGRSAFIAPSEKVHAPILPVFITCDPARDTPAVLKSYLREFHPGIVGLTGTWEQVKDVCKKYRVYFSTPEGVKPGMDYLVDHSIYFYLMDPDGDFVEAIGRQHSAERAAKIILDHMSDWKDGIKKQ